MSFSDALREPRIRSTTRRVMYLSTGNPAKPFEIYGKLSENDKRAIVDIIERIKRGDSLETYYRSGIDNDSDELLDKYGIIHLHLSSKRSKHLLYLMQFEHPAGDYVVILEVNDHKHFKKPVGGFFSRYQGPIKRHRDEQKTERAETALPKAQGTAEQQVVLGAKLQKSNNAKSRPVILHRRPPKEP